MSNIWITGDLHFCHQKSFLYEPRGFSSIEEHNQEVIKRHNSLVKPDDIVYCLGDLILNDNDNGMKLFSQLNGIFLIAVGNHDTDERIRLYKEYMINPTGTSTICGIQFGYRLKFKKSSFILTHYPTIVANKDDPKPVYNIHAHTHSKEHFNEFYNCYCASLDANNCYPISLEQIYKDIRERKYNHETKL